MQNLPILSAVVLLPLIGGIATLALSALPGVARRISLCAAWLTGVLVAAAYTVFPVGVPGFHLVEQMAWIPQWGVSYHVGVDGMSMIMMLLTGLITPLAMHASKSMVRDRVPEFYAFLLFLEAALLGVFIALDLLLFYMFWEIMLVPMALLIGIWGGEARIYAAVKFFLFTMVGSLFMLVAIVSLTILHAKATGHFTTDLPELLAWGVPEGAQGWLFAAFFLAFAIKVPVVPFHTWLPDAHVQAPTAGSVMLAGVLLKMGTYGFVRFLLPMFPAATVAFAPFGMLLGVVGIVYGALLALAQDDLKKLVAYSSISHLGFVVLGIFALNQQSVSGAILQMVNHGISTGALFLMVGMVYERLHTRDLEAMGGLAGVVPLLAFYLLIITLSSIGLPWLNGFVGEFLILVGAMRTSPLFAVLATSGVVLSAVYMLRMYQRAMLGPVRHEHLRKTPDLLSREGWILAPLVALMFWIGIYPSPFMNLIQTTTDEVIMAVEQPVALTSTGEGTQSWER
jgi:NADH-quinone oxidoreductase subunit M